RSAGQHTSTQERLDHQAATERLEYDGDVETRAAEPAVGFGKERADHAELGELLPLLGAVAAQRFRDAVARLERISFGDIAIERVRQHAPIVGVVEVHRVFLVTARGSSWR